MTGMTNSTNTTHSAGRPLDNVSMASFSWIPSTRLPLTGHPTGAAGDRGNATPRGFITPESGQDL